MSLFPITGGATVTAPYVGQAVTLNGTDNYYTIGSAVGGSDTKVGTVSCWFKPAASTSNQFLSLGNAYGNLGHTNESKIYWVMWDTGAGTRQFQFTSATAYTSTSTWYHILISFNLTSGSQASHFYMNDAEDISSVTNLSNGTAYWNSFTATLQTFAHYSGPSAIMDAEVFDFYVNTDEYIDFSSEANRRLFIDASGKPVDLGSDGSTPTGTAPRLFQTVRDGGVAGDFATNSGTGPTLTEVGTTVALAPTSPTD